MAHGPSVSRRARLFSRFTFAVGVLPPRVLPKLRSGGHAPAFVSRLNYSEEKKKEKSLEHGVSPACVTPIVQSRNVEGASLIGRVGRGGRGGRRRGGGGRGAPLPIEEKTYVG